MFEIIVEHVDCLIKNNGPILFNLVAFKEFNVAVQFAIGFALGFLFGGILTLIDKGARALFSEGSSMFVNKFILKVKPDTADTDAERMAFSFVNKFITCKIFVVGIIVASILVFVVTCSVFAAIGFAGGACVGAYKRYQYLSGKNELSKEQQMDAAFMEATEEAGMSPEERLRVHEEAVENIRRQIA